MKEIIEANSGTLSAKAVSYESLGGAEIIKIVDRTVRIPEAGEVRIRVKAAGVNPTDALLRKMDNPMMRFFPSFLVQMQQVLLNQSDQGSQGLRLMTK